MALEPLFNDIAAAIHEKDGKTDGIVAEDFPDRIRAIPSVPTAAPPKDVNFYDYDGTLVYSYTLAEAQALTDLPKGPTHEGLAFQGWNWTLEKIKALTRPMNVGAMYITDDGKTRLKIRIWDTARSNVPLYISQTMAHGVTIDWGDGSATETLAGTGNVNTTHQYPAVGDYTISLAVADGCILGFGNGTTSCCVMGDSRDTGRVYCNLLRQVNIGSGVIDIATSAFAQCSSLASVTIPDGVTSIGEYAFQYCRALVSVTIPDSVTIISGAAFRFCYSLASVAISDNVTIIRNFTFQDCPSLASVTIPDSVTSVGAYAFRFCYSLASVTIPDSVTSVGAYAFQSCSGMAECHLKPTTPPTLANANAFEGIPSDCIIYVPKGSLEAYKTAENWSVYASHMREEEHHVNQI